MKRNLGPLGLLALGAMSLLGCERSSSAPAMSETAPPADVPAPPPPEPAERPDPDSNDPALIGSVYKLDAIQKMLEDGVIRLATREDAERWAAAREKEAPNLYWLAVESKLESSSAYVILKKTRIVRDEVTRGLRHPMFFLQEGVPRPMVEGRITLLLPDGRCWGSCPD
jgi:hypothetical protein